MGQAAKRKRSQSGKDDKQVQLSGEQAEVFNAQMDADRAMFESSDAIVCFRPQIIGEWNEYEMLGHEPPVLGPLRNGEWDFLPQQCTWTAVVDVIRAQRVAEGKEPGKASGCRSRLQCVPLLTEEDKSVYSELAQRYVLNQLALIRDHGSGQ